MSLGLLISAFLQLIAFIVVGYFAGAMLKANRSGRDVEGFSWPERILLIVPGFVAFAVVLMIVNIITIGFVFGTPGIVPLAAIAVVAFGWRRERGIPEIPWLLVAGAILVLGLIYVLPVILNGTGVRTGDPPWHLGWTQQLLHGLPVPVGPAPEIAPQLLSLGPSRDARLLDPAGSGFRSPQRFRGAACRHGSGPAVDGGLSRPAPGPAGWLAGSGGDRSDRRLRLALLRERRVHHNSKRVPLRSGPRRRVAQRCVRDVAAGIATARSAWSCSARPRAPAWSRYDGPIERIAVLAGVVAGLSGLVNLPMLIGALVWLGAATVAAPAGSRRKLGLAMLVPALVVMLPWAGKVVVNYVRFGGFLSTSPSLGVEWPLRTALWSWGILLFLSVLGVVLAVVLRPSGGRTMLALLGGSVVLLVLAIARGAQDWDLWGNATLFHQGRIWPPLHLLGGAFGGYGLALLFVWLRERIRVGAFVAIAAIVAFGAISPVVAARGFGRILEANAEGFVYGSPDYAEGSFAQRVSSHFGPDDTVQVIAEGGAAERQLAFSLFGFSGVRLAGYNDPRLAGNDLRIRYADLAREYDERTANDNFEVDYAVVLIEEATEEPLETGTFAGREWALVRR